MGKIVREKGVRQRNLFLKALPITWSEVMSIPWILVLYKKRKRIAEAVSFLLLVIVVRNSVEKTRNMPETDRRRSQSGGSARLQSSASGTGKRSGGSV